MSCARSGIVHGGDDGDLDLPCPRWSCRRTLYFLGGASTYAKRYDHILVLVNRELQNTSHGASGDTIYVSTWIE